MGRYTKRKNNNKNNGKHSNNSKQRRNETRRKRMTFFGGNMGGEIIPALADNDYKVGGNDEDENDIVMDTEQKTDAVEPEPEPEPEPEKTESFFESIFKSNDSNTEGDGNDEDEGDEDTNIEDTLNIQGKQCLNVQEGVSDYDIEKYLDEDPNSIVFILESGVSSVCVDREQVSKMLNDLDNYYYLCRGGYEKEKDENVPDDEGFIPIDVGRHNICQTPFFGLGFLGLQSKGIVLRENIKKAIEDTDDNIFVIRPFDPHIKSVSLAGVGYFYSKQSSNDAISSAHCQPDTGDEIYYLETINKNIIPEDIQETIKILISTKCAYKEGEKDTITTQKSGEGKVENEETENKVKILVEKTDFSTSEIAVYKNAKLERERENKSESEHVSSENLDENQQKFSYEDTVLFYETLPSVIDNVNKDIADILNKVNLLPNITIGNETVDIKLDLRNKALLSTREYIPKYFETLINGFTDVKSGMICLQSTQEQMGKLKYYLKPVYKFDNFSYLISGEEPTTTGSSLTKDKMEQFSQDINAIQTDFNNVMEEENEREKEGLSDSNSSNVDDTPIEFIANEPLVLIGQTKFHQKVDISRKTNLCVNMVGIKLNVLKDIILNDEDGSSERTAHNEKLKKLFDNVKDLISKSEDYLSETENVGRTFTISGLTEGVELLQFKFSLEPKVMKFGLTISEAGSITNPLLRRNIISHSVMDLRNVFTYF